MIVLPAESLSSQQKHANRPNTKYRISSVIRRSFFSFQNNPKDLDPSYKTDLDLLDYLGRVKLVL